MTSCDFLKQDHIKTISYKDSDQIEFEYYYVDPKDTTSYEFISYYENGQIKSKGNIVHSKKEGIWENWFVDGIFKGKIEYINGRANDYYEDRVLPSVIIYSDSLKVGLTTKFKIVNLYPNDILASNNGIIAHTSKDSLNNFVIIPEKEGRVDILYVGGRFIDQQTTKKISEDSINTIPVTVQNSIILKSLPVYKE